MFVRFKQYELIYIFFFEHKQPLNLYHAADLFHKAKTAGKNLLLVDAGIGVSGIVVLNPSTKKSYPVERFTFELKKLDSEKLYLLHVLRQGRMRGYQMSTILKNIVSFTTTGFSLFLIRLLLFISVLFV